MITSETQRCSLFELPAEGTTDISACELFVDSTLTAQKVFLGFYSVRTGVWSQTEGLDNWILHIWLSERSLQSVDRENDVMSMSIEELESIMWKTKDWSPWKLSVVGTLTIFGLLCVWRSLREPSILLLLIDQSTACINCTSGGCCLWRAHRNYAIWLQAKDNAHDSWLISQNTFSHIKDIFLNLNVALWLRGYRSDVASNASLCLSKRS